VGSNALSLIGRIMLAAIFLITGFGKIEGFQGVTSQIASKGLPLPEVLAVATITLEVVGGLMLVFGWKTRWAALALATFTVLAGVLFHNFWAVPEAQKMLQQIQFLKNVAIMGGLLLVVAYGPGRFSIDRR
jgi:putative oxidoreductase